MHLREQKMATHHDKQTAKGLCKRAIEGQTNNPLSHVFLFFNSLLVHLKRNL